MSSTEKSPLPLKSVLFYGALFFTALIVAILSSSASFRKFLSPNELDQRRVLAKINGQFGGKNFTVYKISLQKGLLVEIYENTDSDFSELKPKQKFFIPDDSEALLMVKNNPMNLGIYDYDGDGTSEVLVPSVDRNGNSRLNIYKYNAELSSFEIADLTADRPNNF